MEFGLAKPGKRDRIDYCIAAMHTVDLVNGTYRATDAPIDKKQWIGQVWSNSQVLDWMTTGTGPDINWLPPQGGGWRMSRDESTIVYQPGNRPMTDLELAKMFAYSARYVGLPDGSRKAAGLVHDPSMLMCLTAALWVHKPTRALEFHDLTTAVGLNVGKPNGGWNPKAWA